MIEFLADGMMKAMLFVGIVFILRFAWEVAGLFWGIYDKWLEVNLNGRNGKSRTGARR